jgi:hypothetical protein
VQEDLAKSGYRPDMKVKRFEESISNFGLAAPGTSAFFSFPIFQCCIIG